MLFISEICLLVTSFIYFIIIIIIIINEYFRCFYKGRLLFICKKLTKHILLGGRWFFGLIFAGFIVYTLFLSIGIKNHNNNVLIKSCVDKYNANIFKYTKKRISNSVIPLNATMLGIFILFTIIDCAMISNYYLKRQN
jgi:hypothetical protein